MVTGGQRCLIGWLLQFVCVVTAFGHPMKKKQKKFRRCETREESVSGGSMSTRRQQLGSLVDPDLLRRCQKKQQPQVDPRGVHASEPSDSANPADAKVAHCDSEGVLKPLPTPGVVATQKRACLKQETLKFNEKIVEEASTQKQWDAPLFGRVGFSLVLGVIVLVLFGTVLYFAWAVPRWFPELTWQQVGVGYAVWLRVYFAVVAFFILASGSQARWVDQRATTIFTTEQEVLAFLFGFSPLTDRLYKQMFPCDCLISELDVKSRQALIDPNAIVFTESVICGNIFRSIETAVLQQPVQPRGRINLWRSWFRSCIVQENFVFNRATLDEIVVRFIDQNLFPYSPQPKPTCWARWTAEPVRLLVGIVVVFTVVLTLIYWPLAPLYYGSHWECWELYLTIIETIYISLLVLLLALDNQEMAFNARFNFLHTVVGAGETSAISNYPNSVPLTQEFSPCNKILQTVYVDPLTLDESQVLLYNMTACQVFFSTIATELRLLFPPPPETVRAWRAAFLSPTVRKEWRCSRCFYVPETVLYIDAVLYNCPGCTSFYEPPPPPRLFLDDIK